MLFCPTCANLLLVENSATQKLRFFCQTCPYVYNVVQKLSKKTTTVTKVVDDVLGGEEAWSDAPLQPVICPHCGNGEARFREMQTRSADEPMTIFYRCTKCSKGWTEN